MENKKRSGDTVRRSRQSSGQRPRTSDNRPTRSGTGSPTPNRNRQRARARRRRVRRTILTIIIIILAAAGLCAAFLFHRFSPTKEKADLNKYYGIKNEDQLAVIVNNTITESSAIMSDGHAYVDYSIVRDYINSTFYWNANDNTLLYTLPESIVSVSADSSEYSVADEKNSEDYVIFKTDGNTAYIAADFIQKYTNLDYKVYEDPQRIVINSQWGDQETAAIKKKYSGALSGRCQKPCADGD